MKSIKNILLLYLFLIPSLLFCQDKDFQSFLLNSSITNKSGYSADLPIIKNPGNAVIIKVIIDEKPYNFLFDTGAMISLISKEAAGKTKYLDKITITDNLGYDQKHSTVKKNVLLNDIEFKDIGFAIMDFSYIEKNSCMKIDGIFGANAIKLCNWQIDPSINTLKLSDNLFSTALGAVPIELKYHAELLPLVAVTLNSNTFLTLLDTGDNGNISLNNESFKKANVTQPIIFSGEGIYKGTFNSMQKERIEATMLEKIFVGGQNVLDIRAIISNDKSALGNTFLRRYITTINTEERKLYLKSIEEIGNTADGSFDINFCRNDKDELVICFVWDNSPLKNGGVKFGDKIVELDGVKLDKLTDDQYCKIKTELNNLKTVTVKVFQGKEEKAYTLTRTER